MKTIITMLCGLIFSVAAIAETTNIKKVLISKTAEHPALDETVKGIIDELAANGFKQGTNLELRIESAQGNSAIAAQIATKFANQNPDVVVGVATVAAQSFSKYANQGKVKLIFSTVTDPVLGNIVKNLEKPENNTSGVSNFIDLEPQIRLFQKIQPNLKTIGIIYNPSEINSVSIIKKLEALCPKVSLNLIKQVANRTVDIPQVAAKLVTQVDAIFISNDNTALSSLPSIIKAANKVKVPVYVSDTDAVRSGALAALGPNQYQVGQQTARMIMRIFNGEEISKMPVEFPDKTDLYLNLGVARKLGIEIPEDLKSKVTKFIE